MATLTQLPPGMIHQNRQNHNMSKLPSYRVADLLSGPPPLRGPVRTESLATQPSPLDTSEQPTHDNKSVAHVSSEQQPLHQVFSRARSSSASIIPTKSSVILTRHRVDSATSTSSNAASVPISAPAVPNPRKGLPVVPASHSRNDLKRDSWTGPPPSMKSNTSDWVRKQSISNTPSTIEISPTTVAPAQPQPQSQPQPQPSKPPLTPLIRVPPIRAFKSSRQSAELYVTPARRLSMDQDTQDETLRALEGLDRDDSQRSSNRGSEGQNSDDSDLFLKVAREESTNNASGRGLVRRSQIDRKSLPPSSSVFQSAMSRRRGSDHEQIVTSRPADEPGAMSQALVHRSTARDRAAPLEDLNRTRYYGSQSRSNPTTPRVAGGQEMSPDSQASYNGRRPSVPDSVLPPRINSYRQSNLSFSAPRTYNSSPLVSRTADHEIPETHRGAEGTESTVSTTAPSTVWDELDEIKSRIHRLELTGKLPSTSGAAISRASNERPRTATTTVTTMSSSPKRGSGNSASPIEPVELSHDVHPLLHSALTKSKPFLSPEVFRALENAASDALAITSMMGSSGHPGPISSSQSTVGGASGQVSDRQVRRKADSMCRSLTELCLALSEAQNEPAPASNNQISLRPSSHEEQTITNLENNQQRPSLNIDLARIQSNPRTLSRLEARRSSLLATSSLPSPKYSPSDAGTPTQSTMAGRRSSALLRSRRAGTEEPEEEDDTRFRAPSRANTDIGRVKNSPREYTSQQPMPDTRQSGIPSALPRRHYVSTSLTNTVPPPSALPSLGNRRYLERSTPERDHPPVGGKFNDDQPQRKLSQGFALGRAGSLTQRLRPPNGEGRGVTQQAIYQ